MRLLACLLVAAALAASAQAQTTTQTTQAPTDAPPATTSPFKDESILAHLPDGWKLGYQQQQTPVLLLEFVPEAETVEAWSSMITHVIIGDKAQRLSIALSASGVVAGYARACGMQDAAKLAEGQVNGYAYELWRVSCPLNPQTGKPEHLHMKVIRGADALYNVQYAYRAPRTPENDARALAYLDATLICDPRTGANPCPASDYAPVTLPGAPG